MKELHVRVSDCSHDEFIKIALKCGFDILEGGKHTKIKTIKGEFITTVPRHRKLKRETAKGIVECFNKFGAKIEIR